MQSARAVGRREEKPHDVVFPRSSALGALALPMLLPAQAWRRTIPPDQSPSWCGYTPGATSDLLARTLGERLNAAWGQPVIIDNRPGASGNIAAAYVGARARPTATR